MKFRDGKTHNYIEADIKYIVETAAVQEETFYVQKQLLEAYDLTIQIFVSFLEQTLDTKSPHYSNCLELWWSNLSSRTSIKIDMETEIGVLNVTKIVTDSQDIDLTKDIRRKNGWVN